MPQSVYWALIHAHPLSALCNGDGPAPMGHRRAQGIGAILVCTTLVDKADGLRILGEVMPKASACIGGKVWTIAVTSGVHITEGKFRKSWAYLSRSGPKLVYEWAAESGRSWSSP